MQKLIVSILSLLLFSCAEKKSDKNLQITGNVKGLKKGTLYIQKVKDTSVITIDTILIDGDSHFATEMNIDSPEMFYLFLDRGVTKSIDNSLPFFVEPGKIDIETTLNFFSSDAKITGSKNQELYNEYKLVASRFVDQDLELIKKRFEAIKNKNVEELNRITEKQESIIKKKYLYTTNFAVNNADFEVAPYLALAEIPDINLKYLDTIQKSLSPKVAKSTYGKKLDVLIKERKASEK
mgnify:CR=1 FL=1|jgi:hypothetical protein